MNSRCVCTFIILFCLMMSKTVFALEKLEKNNTPAQVDDAAAINVTNTTKNQVSVDNTNTANTNTATHANNIIIGETNKTFTENASTSSVSSNNARVSAIPGSGAIAMQVISGLGLVTLAIFVLAWLAKRLGAGGVMQQRGMKVISSLPLGTREKTVLLEVENRKILVGVTANNISCLHVFDPSSNDSPINEMHHEGNNNNEIDRHGELSEELPTKKWDFSHYLKQFNNRENNSPL